MVTPKQKEVLEHPVREQIYEHLKGQENPQSLPAIAEAIEERDLAVVHFHLNRLVEVELVEKVWGTNLYRVVGK